jgi:CBS domain containing-hemolysin-like protein
VTPVLALLVGVLVVVLITAATAYFVAQEFAYMAVDRSRLQALAATGDRRADRALRVTRRTSFMLSGAQLGITVTGLLVGYVAEPLIGESLSTLMGGLPIPVGASIAIGAILALAFSTMVQMLLGELFPKNLAIARAEPVALRLSRSTLLYLGFMGWLIWVFDAASNRLLRTVGIEPVHDVEHSASARDLERIVEESRDSGALTGEMSELLERILDFPQRDVEHARIPRPRADTVSPGTTIEEIRSIMARGHSRYPVLSDEGEEILGVVHLVDVLAAQQPSTASVLAIARPALILPSVMELPRALQELDRSGEDLACVVDEYGGFAGILTVEDLAEELVGEIADEHDEAAAEVAESAGGGWLLDGATPLDEVERLIDRVLPDTEAETLAGLLIASVGDFPAIGDQVVVALPVDPDDLLTSNDPQQWRLVGDVLRIDRHVPSRVRLRLEPPSEPGETR